MTMTADVSISGVPFDPEEAIVRARKTTGRELSAAKLDQYRWLLTRYPRRIAAVLPVLRLIEEEWGVIDDLGMRYAALLLDCPPSHVSGIVTFYTHFHTAGVGRFCLDVCMTLPCALRGSGALLSHLQTKLGVKPGETTSDGLFTIRKVECLASCATAPMLQCGDDYHELLDAAKVDALIDSLRAEAARTPRKAPPAGAALNAASPIAASPIAVVHAVKAPTPAAPVPHSGAANPHQSDKKKKKKKGKS